jgi:hypothetical protein
MANPMLINLTGHPITILDNEGNRIVTIPASNQVPRCIQKTQHLDTVKFRGKDIPITSTLYMPPMYMPEPQQGTYFIVSKLIAERLHGVRRDLLIANGIVRDPNGGKMGCKSLAVL